MNARYDADAAKRYNDWAKKWDELEIPSSLSKQNSTDIKKTLMLLANYIGMHTTLPNGLVRFFSGHPNRRYTNEVESAISSYFVFHHAVNVKEILTVLKNTLRPALPLIGHGDLKALLLVVKDKTGEDFFVIPATDQVRRQTLNAADAHLL